DLVAHGAGLVAVALSADADFVRRLAGDFAGRAYLAAHHLYRGDDAQRLARLAGLAADAGVRLVATNDVLYHVPERRRLQDVLTCIRAHCTIGEAGWRLAAKPEPPLSRVSEWAGLSRGREDARAATVETAGRSLF